MKQKVCPICDNLKPIERSFTTHNGSVQGICNVCVASYGRSAESELTTSKGYIKHGLTINGRTARRKYRFVKVKKS